jgi:hypothetical protein
MRGEGRHRNGPSADGAEAACVGTPDWRGDRGRSSQPRFLHSGERVQIANSRIVRAIRIFFEPWLVRRINKGMTTSQVTCKCGALYERTEFHSAPREADSFVCSACGHILKMFSDVKAPRYRLISGPSGSRNRRPDLQQRTRCSTSHEPLQTLPTIPRSNLARRRSSFFNSDRNLRLRQLIERSAFEQGFGTPQWVALLAAMPVSPLSDPKPYGNFNGASVAEHAR